MKIHPTAVVAKEADLAPDVEIGPFAIIGPHVHIGAGTKVMSHVVIDGYTRIGERCLIHSMASLGSPAQDKKFKGGKAYLNVGSDNIIREHATMNAASRPEAETRVGDRNYFMIGSHVGHDCTVGNDVTISNSSALGGFSVVGDFAVIGGLVGVHQYCRIGRYAMVGGVSKVITDIAPFSLCTGNPAAFFSVNAVGLKRWGYASTDLKIIKKALILLLASGRTLTSAKAQLNKEYPSHGAVNEILEFFRTSKRGVARVRQPEV